MAFKCFDCGNKSTKKFPKGQCPACDSFNVRNTNSLKDNEKIKATKTRNEIILLILLWGSFAYGLWDRYLRDFIKH